MANDTHTTEERHVWTQRVYDALGEAKLIPTGYGAPSGLAGLLVFSAQQVKHWDKRGPSEGGLLLLQEKTGLNATWVRTGSGPKFIAEPTDERVFSDDVMARLQQQSPASRAWVESIVTMLLAGPAAQNVVNVSFGRPQRK